MMVSSEYIQCEACNSNCYGTAVSLWGKYYHQHCFSCSVSGCKNDLRICGYFLLGGKFYCKNDYYQLMGTTCKKCEKYIEGEAIAAVHWLYHPNCFSCWICNIVFPPSVEICFDGEYLYCQNCYLYPGSQFDTQLIDCADTKSVTGVKNRKLSTCAGCCNDIKTDQSLLLALDKQWHLWCFNCFECGILLFGDYMVKDGKPYCEQDYQSEFGVACASCSRYITGKVLQAGDNHYHPYCSHCAKCGEIFGEGEEMYLQGAQIWHPHCCKELQIEVETSGNIIPNDCEFEAAAYKLIEGSSSSTSFDIIAAKHVGGADGMNNDHLFSGHAISENKKSMEDKSGELDNKCSNQSNLGDVSVFNIWRSSSIENLLNPKSKWESPNRITHVTPTAKPLGIHSVKTESALMGSLESMIPGDVSIDAPPSPPPPPPPPIKSSSILCWQKYITGVCKTKVFDETDAKNPSLIQCMERMLVDKSDNKEDTSNSSSYSINSHSSNGSNERDDKKEKYTKGIGYNKLKHRRSLHGSDKFMHKLPTDIDHERLQKFLEDPDHNVYLNDREFFQVFKITREKFYVLPQSKKEELKREVLLF